MTEYPWPPLGRAPDHHARGAGARQHEMYGLLRDRVISGSGKEVRFEPGLVIEFGYSEIQMSPNYEGGFALRFPRFIRLRDDKSIDEIETLESIRERYTRQSAAEKG